MIQLEVAVLFISVCFRDNVISTTIVISLLIQEQCKKFTKVSHEQFYFYIIGTYLKYDSSYFTHFLKL